MQNLYLNQTNVCRVKCKFCAFAVTQKQPDAYTYSGAQQLQRQKTYTTTIATHTVSVAVSGNKNASMLQPHAHSAARLAQVEAAYRAPSLYDEALRLLARRGLAVPKTHTERDWTQPYTPSDEVEQAWLVAYRDPEAHWDLYQLGEELTDLEDAFRLWRFRHVTTVERVIGFKRGTGGTSGVGYLRKMLDVVLFPEIWKLRTDL